jgi:tetratricopeptide (TPR) repeat protein
LTRRSEATGRKAAPGRLLKGLGTAAEVVAPLAGREVSRPHAASQDWRAQLAAALGFIGVLFAALRVILQIFDLVSRPIVPLMTALPYVIGALFVGGAGLSAYMLARSPSATSRKRAAGVLASIVVVGLAWGGWTVFNRFVPPGKVLVSIADFDGLKATKQTDFSRRIYDQITTEMRDLAADVEVQQVQEIYKTGDQARARGLENKATLVVWGWYDDTGVRPYVELLQVPALQREAFSVPMLLSGVASGGLTGLRGPTPRDLKRFVHVPATMTDFDLFVRNGPDQVSFISTAMLGLVFYLQGDTAQALTLFNRAIANADNVGAGTGAESLYFLRGTVLYQQNRVAEAAADWQKAVALSPNLFEAHLNLALAYSEMCTPARQLERALAEADTAVQLKPNDPSGHRVRGELLRQFGKPDQAVTELQTALKLDPNDALAYESLARALSEVQREEDAAAARRQAVALREKAAGSGERSLDTRLVLADSYMVAGEYGKALTEYQAAEKLAPKDTRVYRGLANVHYWQGDYAASEREYRRWMDAAPNDPDAHLLLGLLLKEEKKTPEAIQELQQATNLSSCSADAHLLLATLYHDLDDQAKAIAELEAVTAIDTQNADALYMLGTLRYFQKDLGGAARALQAALAIRSDMPDAHFALYSVYADQGQHANALKEIEAAVALKPNELYYLTSLAFAYEGVQRWNDAVAAYERALAVKDTPDIRLFVGLVHLRVGNGDAALEQFQKGLALDPFHPALNSALGELWARRGQLDQAAAALEKALSREDNASTRALLASVYARQGKTDAAIAEYQKAGALDPKDWLSRLQLANLYRDLGRLEDAVQTYRAVLAIKPDSVDAYAAIAGMEYKRCNINAAAQAANSAAALAPGLASYRATLAAYYEGQGRSADAAKIYADLRARPAADWFAHLVAGEYLLRTGQLNESERELQSVLEQPNLPPLAISIAHADLGQVAYTQARFIAAESEFTTAVNTFTANASAQTWLGAVNLRQGDAAGALAAYDKAAALLPAYAQQVSPDGAATLAVSIQVGRGLALTRLGRSADAAAAFDQAVNRGQELTAQWPKYPLAHFSLGYAYAAREDKAKADAEFSVAAECDQSLGAARAKAEADLAALRR